MGFRLTPQENSFYDLFAKSASNLVEGSRELTKMLGAGTEERDSIATRMREIEHAADEATHEIIRKVNSSFITPFDREDIHQLVGQLDDIVDGIDALAKRFPLYHVKHMEPIFQKQTQLLVASTQAVSKAVHQLRHTRRLSELKESLIEIHHLESLGDDNHHAAISDLFVDGADVMRAMRWKELFDLVEEAIDGCEDVGNTLERIVLKNG